MIGQMQRNKYTPVHPVSTPGCGRLAGWRAADSGCCGCERGAEGRAATYRRAHMFIQSLKLQLITHLSHTVKSPVRGSGLAPHWNPRPAQSPGNPLQKSTHTKIDTQQKDTSINSERMAHITKCCSLKKPCLLTSSALTCIRQWETECVWVTMCLELSVIRNIRPSTPCCTMSTETPSFPASSGSISIYPEVMSIWVKLYVKETIKHH